MIEVPLDPGQYLVEARLPSGERARSRIEIVSGVGRSSVSLDFALSSHEWMGTAQYLDSNVGRRSRAKRRGEAFVAARSNWRVSVVCRKESQWLPLPGVVAEGPADDEARMYAIADHGPPEALRLLVIRSVDGEAHFTTVLPTAWPGSVPSRLDLIIHTPSHSEEGSNPRTTLARPGDPLFDGLVAFACIGEVEGVREATAASFGEARLMDKFSDPVGAVLGAYVLLRLREFDRLHGWTENLVKCFPWLPDGFIALAWQRVLEGRTDEVPDLIERAVDAGPPIFGEGLRLLGDSLALLRRRLPDVVARLDARILIARSAWMRSRPFTSFDLARIDRYSKESNQSQDAWQLRGVLGG